VRYKWDKDLGECQVKWDDYIVALNLGTVEKSKVTKNNNDPSPKEYEKALEKAISLFNNDSFWLVAPFKIFDLVTESGAFLPKSHEFGPMTLSMGNVRGYNKNPEGLE